MSQKFELNWKMNAFQVDWMYFVAFAAVAVGLVIYSGYVILQFLMVDILFCRLLPFAVWDSVEAQAYYVNSFL